MHITNNKSTTTVITIMMIINVANITKINKIEYFYISDLNLTAKNRFEKWSDSKH